MEETNNRERSTETTESVADRTAENKQKPESAFSKYITVIVVAVLVMLLVLGGLYVFTEGEAQEVSSDVSGIDASQVVVARVNGADIVGSDLITSMTQISATAELQGIDITDPGVQTEIRAQAIELLINTELLEQAAEDRGITIADATVDERISALVAEIGSEDALMERMNALGISESILERDVKSELLIQELLEQVFAEVEIEVTEEEILELYETATGGDEEAPLLEEVRPEIEAQLRANEEQGIIDTYITDLRVNATIETLE
jgi:parvulin-like peptidyl-prolyl isomerase